MQALVHAMLPDLQTALAARIDAALPQTQCTRCAYPDCASYARAVAAGDAGINQCPPGGAEGVARLARITGRPVLPLNLENGLEHPRAMAVIDEAWCIGCTLCIAACPTDAIFGSNKTMHSVIEAYCTGCELCIPVCPVDCIQLENASGTCTGWDAWSPADAARARGRYDIHHARLAAAAPTRFSDEGPDSPADAPAATSPLLSVLPLLPTQAATDNKRATIEAALARARARRAPPAG